MAKNLVIVESPAKARTIGRFLGSGYTAIASMGHVRDLPKRKMGVAIEDDFQPEYLVMPDKKKVVSQVAKESRQADTVYLATDPDREGEAISWHLMEAAKIPESKTQRVVFHEITRDAIEKAFADPGPLDRNLIDAQQARRILDRVVGYRLSPVLWRKVRRGLSAGRVQSVALRLIVDREAEIDAFVAEEYWTIDANLAKRGAGDDPAQSIRFKAGLRSIQGRKGQIKIPDGQRAGEIRADLEGAEYAVDSVRKTDSRSRPRAPFITSTLQQEAARKLRFNARRTMQIAQQLYEGINVGGGEGQVGLITYMRTDSTNVAASAVQEARSVIARKFGPEFMPNKPRAYTRRVKGAQEAHEAIRPTSLEREPAQLRQRLNRDQYRLYRLIWERMLASQMSDALFDSTRVDVAAPGRSGVVYLFRATGRVLKFRGHLALYMEGRDDGQADENEETPPLPPLEQGDALDCLGVAADQHFTKPPPRYTEATLIKQLEQAGIGRPSTYAPIMSTIMSRDYVVKDQGRFVPTKLGKAVVGLLTNHFPNIMDVGFTGEVEKYLDDISEGKRPWVPTLRELYDPFDASVERALKEAERVPSELIDEESDEVCEKCERPMVIKSGRYGRFLACTGFPECKETRPLLTGSNGEPLSQETIDELSKEVCVKCERPMVLKSGRYGPFLSCSGYPECKESRPVLTRVGVKCPECGSELVERQQKGGRRRRFYGCSNYPACKFLTNQRPLSEPCPECGKLLVASGRANARCAACGYTGPRPQAELATAEV